MKRLISFAAVGLGFMCQIASAQTTVGQPIPAVLSCTEHRDYPKDNPPFSVSFLLQGANGKVTGSREIKNKPGREDFNGSLNPSNGEIVIDGTGRFYGRVSWRYSFKGVIAKTGDTHLRGHLLQATAKKQEHAARDCLLTFQLGPVDLRNAIASMPQPAAPANVNLADQMKSLGIRAGALEANQQLSLRKLGGLERGQKQLQGEVAATKDQVAATKDQVDAVQRIAEGLVLPPNERPADWAPRVAAIPVQQQQFCQIVDRYHQRLLDAIEARNELARASVNRERLKDLAALLPEGRFENWVLRIVQVDEVNGGSAAVVVIPPCRAVLGNGLCRNEADKGGLIGKGTAPFRELEKVAAGDFVIVSGAIDKIDDKVTQEANADAKMTKVPTSPVCGDKDDTFAVAIRYLARMN